MLSAGFAFFGLSRVDGYVPPANDYAVNRHSWYMLPAFAFIAPPFAAIDEFKGGAALFMLIYLFFTTKVRRRGNARASGRRLPARAKLEAPGRAPQPRHAPLLATSLPLPRLLLLRRCSPR